MDFETEQNKILSLWEKYLIKDKRSFNEYFEEEHNIILKDCLSYKELKALCEKYFS